MSNLFNYLTTNPRAGSVSPVVDLFNTAFGDNFATPASFSNDNIRFNESEDGARIEIDLPGVKKENLKVKVKLLMLKEALYLQKIEEKE